MVAGSSQDKAAQAIAAEIRECAEKILILSEGLRCRYPDLATEALKDALALIKSEQSVNPSRSGNVVSIPRGNSEIRKPDYFENMNDFIVAITEENQVPISVQQIADSLADAGFDINRPSLVVKLHRLVKAHRLSNPTKGHYGYLDQNSSRRQ